jgi:hypothetical protein
MANARLFRFWADLTDGLRTGRPQNETKTGGSFFPEQFPWSGYRTFADIGCAEGGLGVHLARRHPHLIELPDGFDYTGAECQQWLREAGFRRTYVEHLAGPESMVV